jgi:hypothetical protein
MKDMIERAEVVAYLRALGVHARKGMSDGFRARKPEFDDQATKLLAAGLLAAADQIEDGRIDKQRWS